MLSSLVATTAAAACCISYVLHSGSAKLAGLLQMISGNGRFCAYVIHAGNLSKSPLPKLFLVMLIFAGVAVYPAGWNAVEIKEACGQDAHNYHLGWSDFYAFRAEF